MTLLPVIIIKIAHLNCSFTIKDFSSCCFIIEYADLIFRRSGKHPPAAAADSITTQYQKTALTHHIIVLHQSENYYPTSYNPVGFFGSVSRTSSVMPRSFKIFSTDMRAKSFILLSWLKCAK